MKILLAVSRYPWPALSGDRLRAVQCLDFLANHHEITLLAPKPPAGAPSPPAGMAMEFYSAVSPGGPLGGHLRGGHLLRGLADCARYGLPWQNALFYQPDLTAKLQCLAPQFDLVIFQLARLARYIKSISAVPFAIDFIDSLALNFSRRGKLERFYLRPLFRWEASRLRRWESRLVEQARGALVVCQRDREEMLRTGLAGQGDKLKVLPLAFPLRDEEASLPEASGVSSPFVETNPTEAHPAGTLVLTGNLGYFPTVDGFTWWLTKVWPWLHEKRPATRVLVAGSRPAKQLTGAIERAPGQVRLLEAPKDLRAVLALGTVAVAPMRSGSGQPLKIMEAWEAGVPVVASPWAAAGTEAVEGESLRIAREPEDWVTQLTELLDAPGQRKKLATAGRRRLKADYGRGDLQEAWADWVDTLNP